jgi:hypothetical protein
LLEQTAQDWIAAHKPAALLLSAAEAVSCARSLPRSSNPPTIPPGTPRDAVHLKPASGPWASLILVLRVKVHAIRQAPQLIGNLANRRDRFTPHLRNHGVIHIPNRVPQFHLDQLDRFINSLTNARSRRRRWRRIIHFKEPHLLVSSARIKASMRSLTRETESCLTVDNQLPLLAA